MHSNLVKVRLWLDYSAPHFEVRCLLEDGANSDLCVNGAALIRGNTVFFKYF